MMEPINTNSILSVTSKMNIVFVDGKCLICNGLVKFIARYDKKRKIHFCHLQNEKALQYIGKGLTAELSTVAFFREGVITTKSDAVIEVLDCMGYRFFKVFKFMPRILRDGLYTLVSKNRYRIGKELETCPLPSKEMASRFL